MSGYILSQEVWNSTSVPQRVVNCQAVGLSGQVGSKEWGELDDMEMKAVMGLEAPVYQNHLAVSKIDGNADMARVRELVERNKPLVQGILAKYLSGTQSGNGCSRSV